MKALYGAVGVSLAKVSDDGALGSGEMDGADPQGQGSLEVMEDVVGRAWTGALCRNLIQQLLKVLQLNQEHHVLQEVALDEGCQLQSPQELGCVKHNVRLNIPNRDFSTILTLLMDLIFFLN